MITKKNNKKRKDDFSSSVPEYKFAVTLKEQKEQLKKNLLMKRFIESRRKLSTDSYRPKYHFVSPESTMNDPNGLCFWQGRWHLFYQGYPPEDPRQHWGHAVSDDLIYWKDLPYAIYPNPEKCCFSGATFVEDNRVIAMYHGTEVGNMVATSNDPLLLNWEKLTGEAVVPIDCSVPNVFDPCIWEKNGVYYSLSAGTLPHEQTGKRTRADFLLRSKDLKTWEYLHPFVEGDRFTRLGDDGACPYFWPIGDRYILLFFSHMSGGQALLGDYDKERDKFVVTSHHEFNFGAVGPGGVHAPSATPDGKGGVNVIFNMNSAKPTVGWNQIMSLPRKLTLLGKDELSIEPVEDVESLRENHQHLEKVILPANEEVVLENIKGNSMELKAEIEIDSAPVIELNVLRSPDKEELTRIVFYRERVFWSKENDSVITIDSSYSSRSADVQSRPPEIATICLEEGEPLQLRVFVDKSVVEVFVNGKQCVAIRVYPDREDSIGVSLRSQGKNAVLKSLDVWQMKNIYT